MNIIQHYYYGTPKKYSKKEEAPENKKKKLNYSAINKKNMKYNNTHIIS